MSYFTDRAKQLGINVKPAGQARPGESYFAQRARELGISPQASPQPSPAPSPAGGGFFQSRAMDLGIIPDTRPKPHTPTPIPMQSMVSTTNYKALADDVAAQNFVQQGKEQRAAQDPENRALAAIKHNTVDLLGEGVDRFLAGDTGLKPLDAVGRFVNQFSQAGGAAVGVDTQASGAAPLASTGSKIADKAAQIAGGMAGFAVNPAQVESNLLTAPYRAAESALTSPRGVALTQAAARGLGKLGLGEKAAGTIAQRGLTGATAGAIQGAANSGVRGQTDAQDLAISAGLGAGLGGAGDIAFSGLAALFRRNGIPQAEANELLALPERASETVPEGPLGLPASRADAELQRLRDSQTKQLQPPAVQRRMDAAAARSDQPYGAEPIAEPYTFGLPEASPASLQRQSNVTDARGQLRDIDNEIHQLSTQYEQRVIDEYKYLKQSMQDRGGVQQGALLRDSGGEVVGRTGRQSNNPLWYQELYSQKGGKPSNKDLYDLARQRVDNGFRDEAGDVPSWREEQGYDQTLSALQGARSQIANSLREIDPAINITPEPIIGQALRDMRRAGEAKPAKPIESPFTAARNRSAPVETPEQAAARQQVGRQFVGDLSRQQALSRPLVGRLGAPGSRMAVTPEAAERSAALAERPISTGPARIMPGERVGVVPSGDRTSVSAGSGTGRPPGGGSSIDDLWSKVLRGAVTDNGAPSDVLQAAKAVRDRGQLQTIDQFRQLAQDVTEARRMNLTRSEYQEALRNVVEHHSTPLPGAPALSPREAIRGRRSEPGKPEAAAADITPQPLPQQPSSQSLGISAFARRPGAYDNLSTSTKSQLVTRQAKERLPLRALKDKAYTSLVDDLDPINRFEKEVERVTGESLKPSERAHTLALNSRGSDIIAKTILTERQVDAAGSKIGKSLKEILSKLPKNDRSYVDFEDYLVNRHAITRYDRGERVYREGLKWTPDVGRQNIANYEAAYPQFKAMADELYQYQQNMVRKWLVDTGLIPQAEADAWFKANPTYIPNKRFFSELEAAGGSNGGKSKKGIGNQSSTVKKYSPTGSERPIISPIEAIIENTDAFVKAARRNQAMQALVRNLERDPEALEGFAEFVPEEQVAGAQSLKGLNQILNDEGVEGVIAKLGEDFDINFRKATQRGLDKDNIVRVMVKGEPKYIQVNDKPLLEAITAMGPDGANAVMDFLGKVTSIFKMLTTGVNPVFSLTRNIMRDIPQAYAASKTTNNPFQFFGDLAASAWAIVKNKELYQEYKSIGGGHSSPTAADRNLLKRSKDQVLPPSGNPLRGAIPRGYRALQDIMNAWETAPRMGEFKRLAAEGTPESRQAGLAAAQDVTINFKRRGKLGKQLDKVFPYFNAAVQGLDKTGRMFKDDPVKAIAKTALAVSLPAMISYAINYGDPNYDKVSKRVKDNFYLLPKGDGTFFKIAKPKEIGTIFADIPERLLDHFAKQDPDAFRDFADQVRTTFTPPGLQGALKSGGIPQKLLGAFGDTVLGPVADSAANKTFSGAAIVPGYLENVSRPLQADPNTTVIAKRIGEWTGSSPMMLDYLFRQYTGVLGQLGQPLLAPGGSVGSTLSQQVTADPVYSNDLQSKFYDAKDQQDKARADYNITSKLPADYNDGLRKYLDKVSDAMGKIRKQMRAVESDGSLPAAQKREQLRQLQEQINQLAGQGNAIVDRQK